MLRVEDNQVREMFIGQGIGDEDGDWGVYYRKPSGSLKRFRGIPTHVTRSCAEADLRHAGATRKGWKILEDTP